MLRATTQSTLVLLAMASSLEFCNVAASQPLSCPSFSLRTPKLTTQAGTEVAQYALGGSMRATQPASLVSSYINATGPGGFIFFYNPSRYPAFMSGVRESCQNLDHRRATYIASGGHERTQAGMENRLSQIAASVGSDVPLDCFVIEYVQVTELDNDRQEPGEGLAATLRIAQQWKQEGRIRHIGISTHSHVAGAVMAAHPAVDVLLLRYSMSHRTEAEELSLPASLRSGIPVIAFTTTRWGRHTHGHAAWHDAAPTDGECATWALRHPAVAVVLHSATDPLQLYQTLTQLEQAHPMSEAAYKRWRTYGDLDWRGDGFDAA